MANTSDASFIGIALLSLGFCGEPDLVDAGIASLCNESSHRNCYMSPMPLRPGEEHD